MLENIDDFLEGGVIFFTLLKKERELKTKLNSRANSSPRSLTTL